MLESKEYMQRSQTKAKVRVGVMVYLCRNQQEVLLQLRQNTGFCDGFWDSGAGGGVEVDQTPTQAATAEARQELGVVIRETDLKMIGANWVITERGEHLLVISFSCDKWEGEPQVCEPDKCAGIHWFRLDALPVNFMPDKKQALLGHLGGEIYKESDERSISAEEHTQRHSGGAPVC